MLKIMSLSELLQTGEVLQFILFRIFIFQIIYISPGDIYRAGRIRPWNSLPRKMFVLIYFLVIFSFFIRAKSFSFRTSFSYNI